MITKYDKILEEEFSRVYTIQCTLKEADILMFKKKSEYDASMTSIDYTQDFFGFSTDYGAEYHQINTKYRDYPWRFCTAYENEFEKFSIQINSLTDAAYF